ncbi:MAG: hypothetical protein LBJ43_00055 [Propionibacteriaceae bacterium]|jgi:pyroglutamyl-peptidase|nr:hypothetical protein [Propionibacteriaceae bacterium]
MTVLVTGFEPFKGLPDNPAATVAELLGGQPGFIHRVLPVTYAGARAQLKAFVNEHPKASMVISIGLWDSGDAVRVEALAHNVQRASIPDNAGDLAMGRPIVADGPKTLAANPKLVCRTFAAFENAGVSVINSTDAGGYICNTLYYTLLQLNIPGIFIHIPLATLIAPVLIAQVLTAEFGAQFRS